MRWDTNHPEMPSIIKMLAAIDHLFNFIMVRFGEIPVCLILFHNANTSDSLSDFWFWTSPLIKKIVCSISFWWVRFSAI